MLASICQAREVLEMFATCNVGVFVNKYVCVGEWQYIFKWQYFNKVDRENYFKREIWVGILLKETNCC